MDEADKRATWERITNILLLSAETAVDNLAAVIAGEKRVAVVPRLVTSGTIYELRLSSAPKPKDAMPGPTPETLGDLLERVLPPVCETCKGEGTIGGALGDICESCGGIGRKP